MPGGTLMRTTLDLPASLLQKAQSILHARTKTETIILGLEQVLRRSKIEGLLAMRGQIPMILDIGKARKR